MDVFKAISELREELRRIDDVIAGLEGLTGKRSKPSRAPRRRGRKDMPPTERAEVSRRMKAYWEKRRATGRSKTSEAKAESATAS